MILFRKILLSELGFDSFVVYETRVKTSFYAQKMKMKNTYGG